MAASAAAVELAHRDGSPAVRAGVGQPLVPNAAETPERRWLPRRTVQTAADAREVATWCRDAGSADAPELVAVAESLPDPLVAGNALRALGRLGGFTEDPALLALLADPRQRVQQEAIRAAGKSRCTGAVEAILEQLPSLPVMARALAVEALSRIGTPVADAALDEVHRVRGLSGLETRLVAEARRRRDRENRAELPVRTGLR